MDNCYYGNRRDWIIDSEMRDWLIKAWINFWYVVVTGMNRVKSRLRLDRNHDIK